MSFSKILKIFIISPSGRSGSLRSFHAVASMGAELGPRIVIGDLWLDRDSQLLLIFISTVIAALVQHSHIYATQYLKPSI